jgi:hypothetical protein
MKSQQKVPSGNGAHQCGALDPVINIRSLIHVWCFAQVVLLLKAK